MFNFKIINNNKGLVSSGWFFVVLTIIISSCDFGYELPEANSIPDETPPSAAFDFKQDEADFLKFNFSNLSASATDFAWDFGDGNSSTEKDAVNTFPDEGKYTVTLTATDKLGVSSTISHDVDVVEPDIVFLPTVLEGGFEDLTLPDGTGDGRDSWRNSTLSSDPIQITTGPVYAGEQAAKLPSDGDRMGYQAVAVLPNTDYRLRFYYTMKSDPGTLTVRILGEDITDLADAEGAAIASIDLTDNSEPNTFVQAILPFNSGDRSVIRILFTNVGSECRLDEFEFIE